ncbi:hypothetical protein AB3G45_07890 [Shinella sp. S4-D37]|uniref:hypothetical protein n=1 Tax=Shinella sp. S4-D37 TaxID=3161999 RepID=UPI003467A059
MDIRICLCAFAALFTSASAASSENLQWLVSQYDNTTFLSYGIPDTDYSPIGFYCSTGDETVRLIVTHDAPDAKDGQQMRVTLSSDAGSVELSASGQFQEIDDMLHLEGQTRLDRKLVRILSANGALNVSIDGSKQDIPLAGAADHIDALVAACGAPLNPNDLEVRITNKADMPIVSLLFSEQGVNDYDGDTYGNQVLAPGDTTYLIIPDGRPSCSFDLRAEYDEEAERDPFEGTQNLCENGEFLIAQ